MSIVELLFPASELKAIRLEAAFLEDEQIHCCKRRKVSSSDATSDHSHRRSSQDSGYSSNEDERCSDNAGTASMKRRRSSQTMTRSSNIDSTLLVRYIRSMHPRDQARYHSGTRRQSLQQHRSCNRDMTAKRLATSRDSSPSAHTSSSSSISSSRGPPTPAETGSDPFPAEIDWNTGSRPTLTAELSTRLLDGIRVTSAERSMLNSLILDTGPTPCDVDETPVMFEGFTIPSYSSEEEEEEEEEDEYDQNSDLENFFDLEEASEKISPSI